MNLYHKTNRGTVFALALFVLAAALAGFHSQYSLEEVQKVFKLIGEIQASQNRLNDGKLRKVKVTESEFNSYIAYRIEAEKEELMKELEFKFLKNDKIEGKAYVDLRGQDIPKILRPEMTFYFSADIEVKDEQIQLNLSKLYLEQQEIRPAVLDLVIMLGSKFSGWDGGGINDWYDLPYGIKDIKVYKGYAEFYY